jgi:hypothetical protein
VNRENTGSDHESDRLPLALAEDSETRPARLKYATWRGLAPEAGSGATAMPRDWNSSTVVLCTKASRSGRKAAGARFRVGLEGGSAGDWRGEDKTVL